MTTQTGGPVAAATPTDDGGVSEQCRVEVSELRASELRAFARRRAEAGDEVHVERRGGRTFVVAADA